MSNQVIPKSDMARALGIVPGVAAFIAGVAVAALSGAVRPKRETAASGNSEMQAALAQFEARLAAQEAATAARFNGIEAKLEDHAARLADVPSTTQIVSAMEQILARTMSSLDERLNSQARSIDTLKTTVSQTDGLLERVLESLDSLQSNESPGFNEDPLLRQRSA